MARESLHRSQLRVRGLTGLLARVRPPGARVPAAWWIGVVVVVVLAIGLIVVGPGLATARSTDGGLAGLWAGLRPVRAHSLTQQADAASARSDWAAATSALSALREMRPHDPQIASRLGAALFLNGQALMKAGDLPAALEQFDAAHELRTDLPALGRARRLVGEYLLGQRMHARGDWSAAIDHLKAARAVDPDFRDATRLLYSAHYQQGVHLQAAVRFGEARAEYQAALALWPDGPEGRAALAEVERILNPPPRKRIVVSLSKQRMYVYENDRTIHEWLCSTGEPGRDTRAGHYKVLSKMKSAYASAWNLDMPFWMGIYYAGASENGIHAPPIQRSNGHKMWEGLLGHRVSFGCVIISEVNAGALYDWAEVGTVVDVVR